MGPRTDRRMAQGRQRAWPAGLGVRGHLRLHLSRRPQGRGPLALSDALAIFARIKPALRKSITFDNDTAFAQHGLLQSMRAMATWFCDMPLGRRAESKTPMAACGAGYRVTSTSIACPMRKSRTSS